MSALFFDASNRQFEPDIRTLVFSHFWLKAIGTSAFMTAFFTAYIYLLKNPAFAVTTMPLTWLDDAVSFQPWSLFLYLSLWLFSSIPVALMRSRRELFFYAFWIGLLCIFALIIFYFFPNAVPPAGIDWSQYPGVAFLKGVDAAGNACPSLHVAAAVFSAMWIDRLAYRVGGDVWYRLFSALWCLGIVYSTMATKQHVSIDVAFGVVLGVIFAFLSKPSRFSRYS